MFHVGILDYENIIADACETRSLLIYDYFCPDPCQLVVAVLEFQSIACTKLLLQHGADASVRYLGASLVDTLIVQLLNTQRTAEAAVGGYICGRDDEVIMFDRM